MDKKKIILPVLGAGVALYALFGNPIHIREGGSHRQFPDIHQDREIRTAVDLEGSAEDLYKRAIGIGDMAYSEKNRIKSRESEEWIDVKDMTLEAIALYNAVIEKFPGSKEAEEAKERVGEIYLDAVLQEAPFPAYIQLGDTALHLIKRERGDVTDQGDTRNFISYVVKHPDGRRVLYRNVPIEGEGNDYSLAGNPEKGLKSLLEQRAAKTSAP